MNSNVNGGNTLISSEVTNISKQGFWVIIGNKEYFVPFNMFPVFRKATVDQIVDLKMLSPNQLYWESLDCDIELASLENPEQFRLMYHK
jgi:hypothetical protein